ncbi:MAG: twin-arginine translocation signal domain-containing protein [Planctomycetota bacterium]
MSRISRRQFLKRCTATLTAAVAHRSTSTCLVANICLRLGRNLSWNPQAECFVNDPGGDKMISRPMRRPWRL